MAQRAEKAAGPQKRKIGIRGLMTMMQVTNEMRRVYAEARRGEFIGGWPAAGTAVRCLERLRYAVASSDLEDRLAVVEERVGVQHSRPNGYRRGHFVDDDEDDHDDFEELRQ